MNSVSEPHLHGGYGFTILHVKEIILLDEGIEFWFLNVLGTFMEGFQGVPHCLSSLKMWDREILVYVEDENGYIPCSQIVLGLFLIIIALIGLRLVLHDTVNIDLRVNALVENDIPKIHIYRLNVNTHTLFPIIIIFTIKNRSSIVSPIRLFVRHVDSFSNLPLVKRTRLLMPLVSLYDDTRSALRGRVNRIFQFQNIFGKRELKSFMTIQSCLIMMIRVRQSK